MKLDVVAFGTHPDDVELFCGGTLVKLAGEGYKTGIVDLTRGELSTRGTVEGRETEAEHAAQILNVQVRENIQMPDGDIQNTFENRKKIIEMIRRFRPDCVLLPHCTDRHPDHMAASGILTDAVFYSGLEKIHTGLEAFRPEQILYYFSHQIEQPNIIVDISTEFHTKLEAILAFKSQFYNPGSKEPETYISSEPFRESIESRARYYGFMIGSKYGEPLYSSLPLKITNFSKFFA